MRLWMLMSLTVAIVCADSLNCSYISLLEHLGVGSHNLTLSALRPIRDWRKPTYVTIDLYLQILIDVNEKLQSVSTVVYTVFAWVNEFISWDPRDFCGVTEISVPKDYLWRPDISIDESMEVKQTHGESRDIKLTSLGYGAYAENLRVTSTCKMDLYKFPFDTQQCKISALAIADRIDQLRLKPAVDASDVTENSLSVFRAHGEWDVRSIHVTTKNYTVGSNTWDRITITRRPDLYVINFLIPVFIFLVLDLVSFFMNESGGEKLGFKVTILLAISVLLLILHDILPSTHQRTPVIGVFCTGVFLFVGCSIVETVTVSFLMRMASKCDVKALTWRTSENSEGEAASQTAGSTGVSVKGSEKLEPPSASVLRLILAELQALRTHMSSEHPEHRGNTCLYLKTAAKWINIVYFLLYICAACVFVAWVCNEWHS